MNNQSIKNLIVLAVALLVPQIITAQGITYLCNLGQTSTGSDAVGSDSSGYSLNCIQLGMTDASGNPSGFGVILYSATL
jgi:hypothetical protein